MRKTFEFYISNKIPERQIEAIKGEIKKYLARERRKELPEGVDYWAFDCKIGPDEGGTKVIKINEINPMISHYFDNNHKSFYIEILAKEGFKKEK